MRLDIDIQGAPQAASMLITEGRPSWWGTRRVCRGVYAHGLRLIVFDAKERPSSTEDRSLCGLSITHTLYLLKQRSVLVIGVVQRFKAKRVTKMPNYEVSSRSGAGGGKANGSTSSA